MARPLRFQYPGANYYVMARGDGGKTVFETDDDRLVFLKRLEEVGGSCGWRAHAWVLMGSHFHLLLETPLPNLGHPGPVSRQVSIVKRDRKLQRQVNELEEM